MRPFILTILVLLLQISCVTKSVNNSQYKNLIWCDEFNYNGLPNSEKWNYEEGFIRNKELQYYTKNRKENARVHNGYLEIRAIKEDYPNFFLNKKKTHIRNDSIAHYTSASITTQDKFSVKYGRIEMRAKLTKGIGTWPAFWMMGINRSLVGWPKCGEIDIMENIGIEPENIYGTCHFPNFNADSPTKKGNVTSLKNLSNKFHIYAIEWNEDKIDFFVNNHQYFTFKIKDAENKDGNPFHHPFYILLNLAIGGDWGGSPTKETNFPQSYHIDYVRVYQ